MGQGPEFDTPGDDETIFLDGGLPGTPNGEKKATNNNDGPNGFDELTGGAGTVFDPGED